MGKQDGPDVTISGEDLALLLRLSASYRYVLRDEYSNDLATWEVVRLRELYERCPVEVPNIDSWDEDTKDVLEWEPWEERNKRLSEKTNGQETNREEETETGGG